ncbi:MAG TPA: HAD family hydrolase, partial [Byssovorax sp.]
MAPPEVTPAWIVSELDRAREEAASADAIVAFDADGTLWGGDVGLDLYEALLDEGGVRDAARDGLAAEARELGLRADGDTLSIVRDLYAAYNEDRWPLARAFAAMAWTFAGWHEAELDAFAARVTVRAKLAARVRPELEPVRAWARERGVDLYVVSASPIAIVALGAALLGVPRANVIAMTPAIDAHGVVEPRLAGRVVYGDGKLESLRALRPNA